MAYALIIYASLEGLINRELPPEASNLNLFALSAEDLERYKKLPENLIEARQRAKSSDFIKKYLPRSMIKNYCK